MREDDDHIRLYTPVLQRVIILLGVICAVPVALWSINAFVRAYVAPPTTPTFRQIATVPPAPDKALPAQDIKEPPAAVVQQAKPPAPATAPVAAPVIEATATTTDAREATAAPKGPLLTDRPPNVEVQAPPPAAPQVAVVTITPPKKDVPSAPQIAPPAPQPNVNSAPVPAAAGQAFVWPNPAPTGGPNPAAQEPPAPNAPLADALPDVAPLTGRIPIPRSRPHFVAVAQATAPATPSHQAVPIPRARPEAAGPPAPPAPDSPFAWLKNIFQPNSTQTSSPPPPQ
jgi:hypothetical protein